MATNLISKWMLLFMLFLSGQVSVGLYMPGFKHVYSTGEPLYAKVRSLTSINSLIPLSYYSLPYCKPPWGVNKSEENLGELLMGDQTLNSAYGFRANVNDSVYLCTTPPLTKHDVDLLKKMTRDMYQVNIFLDSLPVVRDANYNSLGIKWNGFPVGYYWSPSDEDSYYIFNHLKFQVLVHEYEPIEKGNAAAFEIVGFEVWPCSVKHDPERTKDVRMYSNNIDPIYCPSQHEEAQIITEGERVSFSYEVEFVKSDIQWSSRWDFYLNMEGYDIHYFSIINSVITALFLMGVIGWIFLRNMRGHAGYQNGDSLDKEAQQTMLSNKIPESQPDNADAFKGPKLKKLLCVMVGIGAQIMGTAIITVTFAAAGFMSPASRGALLMGILSFYLLLGFVGGFVGVYLWKTIKGTSEGWKSTSWSVASGFPGLILVVHFVLNLILWHQNSTGAIPAFAYLEIFSLWLGISVPLTLLGGFLGAQTEQIKCPSRVEWVPRKASARKFLVWLVALGAGTLPNGTIFIELFSILSSLFLGRYYYFYGFLLVTLLLLIIISVLVSVIVTYMSLRAEDSGWWWWKAFWASGSAAIYVFFYCINYLICDLRGLNGPHSVIIYLGYSIIIAISTMLAVGSVGFLGSFCLVNLLSSSKESVAFRRSSTSRCPPVVDK